MPLTSDELQKMLDHSPFIAFLGLKVTEADPAKEQVTMSCAMRPEFERGAGHRPVAWRPDRGDHRHGRRLCADHGAAPRRCRPSISASTICGPRSRPTSITTATVRRAGKSVGVVDVDVFNDQKALVAVGRATYSTLAG